MPTRTVYLPGKGQVKLTDKDYKAAGGFGKIYKKGSMVYKLYIDPNNMIPAAKLDELSVLTLPNIMRPLEYIIDGTNNPCGLTMNWVDGVAICRMFTNDFRNANGITPEMVMKLVEKIQETTVFIHDKKCLIIDGNELNYLIDDKTFQTPYFIDVDSYQTPSFPATAQMLSIKDWHTKGFSTLTDWFAFAILACQLFIGIHPYKGKHPKYQKRDMEQRMKDNVSIFNPDVRLPSAVRDFSHIPVKMYDWFVKLFEKGERQPPPDVAGLLNVLQVVAQVIQSTNNFDITRLQDYEDKLLRCFFYNAQRIAITRSKVIIGKTDYPISDPTTDVIFTPRNLTPIAATIEDEKVVLRYVKDLYDLKQGIDKRLPLVFSATHKMVIKNHLYTLYDGKVSEIILNELSFNGSVIATVGNSWEIMPQSSVIYDGVFFQDILGKPYLSIPVPADPPKVRQGKFITMHIPELAKYRVVNAKHDNGICMVVARNLRSKYDKLIIHFDEQYSKYTVRILEDLDIGVINFVTLDNGLTVSINDDGSVEIFSMRQKQLKMKTIQDPDIDTDMILCKDKLRVLFFRDKTLYNLKTK